jgi:hypothetical protein
MDSAKVVSRNEPARWNDEQRFFQAWLALPEDEREPKTQAELAERIGVHAITLTRWKALPGFYKAAHDAAYLRLRESLPAVFRNIARRAADGDRREWVDLYLSLMGGAQAVAGANATMTINQMTEDEAMTLLEQGIGLRLTARVADGEDQP